MGVVATMGTTVRVDEEIKDGDNLSQQMFAINHPFDNRTFILFYSTYHRCLQSFKVVNSSSGEREKHNSHSGIEDERK